MTETLIIDPAKMPAQEFDPAVTPEWAALATYHKEAATAGETVTLTAKVETRTPAEVADRLGISRATVMRRIEGGEIAAIKKGSRYRIPLSNVDRAVPLDLRSRARRRVHGRLLSLWVASRNTLGLPGRERPCWPRHC